MATIEVDPISRIEGHLGVKVTTGSGGTITEADAHGNLWRGFENFLIGRRANDAITFTQRICGVCPVPHGTAATMAADSVLGVSKGYATFKQSGAYGIPEAGLHVRNMILASEFLMSSITHFYHLVAQDYVQGPPIAPWTPYFRNADYAAQLRLPAGRIVPLKNASGTYAGKSQKLWDAVITQYVKALRIRRLTFEAGAMFAGRMPMVSALVAGGTTNAFESAQELRDKLDAFRALMEEVGTFVIKEYIPLTLALGALYPKDENVNNAPGVGGNGAGLGNFLAWGGFPQSDDTMAVKGGWVIDATAATPATGRLLESKGGDVGGATPGAGGLDDAIAKVKANITESIARSRYAATYGFTSKTSAAYPGNVTMTEPDRDGGYSWMKAPRWNGYAMEVGPFARMVVNGHYPVDATTKLVAPYASLYCVGGVISGGLDTALLSADLVSGLEGDTLTATVKGYIEGMHGGLSTLDRIRARAIESYFMIVYLIGAPTKDGSGNLTWKAKDAANSNGWVGELRRLAPGTTIPPFYVDTTPTSDMVSGFGLVEAPRGALGHFITATGGKIKSYQCVVPTTWNGSPKNGTGTTANYDANVHLNTGPNRGAIEQATVGVVYDVTAIGNDTVDPHSTPGAQSGVEVMRVAHSFDPCIACAVH